VIGVQAMQINRATAPFAHRQLRRIEIVFAGLLLLLSVGINASGALNAATWKWNALPLNIDQHPERLWDWRQPQFLAGIIRPPLPAQIPMLKLGPVDFSHPESGEYLWYGWSQAEGEYRWTDGKEAALVFTPEERRDISLTLKFVPFLVPNHVPAQRVRIFLNDSLIEEFIGYEPQPSVRTMTLPTELLRQKNVLRLSLPDATSPASLGLSRDGRLLGIAVYSMEFH
jgi:hypothetical protein